jgi:hypothetical protein
MNALYNVVDDLGRFFADAFAFDKTRAPTGEVALASVRVCQHHWHEIIPLSFLIAFDFLDSLLISSIRCPAAR